MMAGECADDPRGLASNVLADLEKLKGMVEQLKSGEVSALQFRAFRVPLGIYEQREAGTYMLRIRLPAGGLSPQQMRAVARASKEYGNGILHLTTRQDIQVHRVPLDALHPALVSLCEVGLSTKGGGGNSVRNITACYASGTCAQEIMDVGPYAVAVTEYLLRDALSFQLPRKFKIAFSGCDRDCPGAMVNDVGFVAKRGGDRVGFAVYAGGGMGAYSRVADLLEPFVPASEAHLVAEAVKRVYDRHGNRRDRHKARLRFLMDRIGFDAFRDLYRQELAALRASDPPALAIDLGAQASPLAGDQEDPSLDATWEGFDEWRRNSVSPQKQEGYYLVQIPFFLGDVAADLLYELANIVASYGEGVLRAEQHQNAFIRWVPGSQLPALHAKLVSIGLATSQPPVLRDLVACAGASTCQLGICLSRGLAKAVARELGHADLDLAGLGQLKIHISGCPNACGRHPIADIGLHGVARRVHGRLAPHYVLALGGKIGAGAARLATGQGTIPARHVPALLRDLLGALAASECADLTAFLEAGGTEVVRALVSKYGDIPAFEQDENGYFDWDAQEAFTLAGRGPGECGAGVFDLIEADLGGASDALEQGRYLEAASLAVRSLLVTRGEQPDSHAEAFALFGKLFLQEGLVEDARLASVVTAGLQAASAADPQKAFAANPEDVAALVAAVRDLYERMDPSLRFPPRAAPQAPTPVPVAFEVSRSYDLRGVVCPLNYVKTKLALQELQVGQVLAVLLDEEGARNVPESAARDGQEVLATLRKGNHWRVLIRKST